MQPFRAFFVTGAPKSGTTWVARLLDAHPQLSCGGESCVHHFGEELLRAVTAYNQLLDRRRLAVGDSNLVPPLTRNDLLLLMRRFVELRLSAVADPHKALVAVGDKDPEHAIHVATLDRLFPDLRLIHVIRDGRAVLVSAWEHNRRAADARKQSLDEVLDTTAVEWADRVRRGRTNGRRLGARYTEVRYEALHARPESTVADLLAFLGVRADAAQIAACLDAAAFTRLSGGRAPGAEDSSSFFRVGLPEAWRDRLTTEQQRRFAEQAGGCLEELGYPVP